MNPLQTIVRKKKSSASKKKLSKLNAGVSLKYLDLKIDSDNSDDDDVTSSDEDVNNSNVVIFYTPPQKKNILLKNPFVHDSRFFTCS